MARDRPHNHETPSGLEPRAPGRWRSWILSALAVVYVLSPVDLVPDVPLVGWIDDLFVMLAAGLGVWRNLRGEPAGPQDDGHASRWTGLSWVLWGTLAVLLVIAVAAALG